MNKFQLMRLTLGLIAMGSVGCSMDERNLRTEGEQPTESVSVADAGSIDVLSGADMEFDSLDQDRGIEPTQDGDATGPVGDLIGADCRMLCRERASASVAACLESGGSDAECEQERRMFMRSCVQDACGDSIGGGAMGRADEDCRASCREQAETAMVECTEAGGSDIECEGQRRNTMRACVRDQCVNMGGGNVNAEDDDCRTDCRNQAEVVVAECEQAGGADEACAQQGRMALRTCVRRECTATDGETMGGGNRDEAEDCRAGCRARSETVVTECIDGGAPENECIQEGRMTMRTCIRAECGNMGGDSRGGESGENAEMCVETCSERSERIEAVCLATGGSEDMCAQRRMRVQRACLDDCPGQ